MDGIFCNVVFSFGETRRTIEELVWPIIILFNAAQSKNPAKESLFICIPLVGI